MIDKNKLIKSAMLAFLTLTTANTAIGAANEAAPAPTEKCYGVVRAGMNDCSTATASCAGSATKDNQADAWLLMPVGLCEKLVGGHLKPVVKVEVKPETKPAS